MPFPFTFIIIAGLYTALGLGTYFTTKPKDNPPVPPSDYIDVLFSSGPSGTVPAATQFGFIESTNFSTSIATKDIVKFHFSNITNVQNIQGISLVFKEGSDYTGATLLSVTDQNGNALSSENTFSLAEAFGFTMFKPDLTGVTKLIFEIDFSGTTPGNFTVADLLTAGCVNALPLTVSFNDITVPASPFESFNFLSTDPIAFNSISSFFVSIDGVSTGLSNISEFVYILDNSLDIEGATFTVLEDGSAISATTTFPLAYSASVKFTLGSATTLGIMIDLSTATTTKQVSDSEVSQYQVTNYEEPIVEPDLVFDFTSKTLTNEATTADAVPTGAFAGKSTVIAKITNLDISSPAAVQYMSFSMNPAFTGTLSNATFTNVGLNYQDINKPSNYKDDLVTVNWDIVGVTGYTSSSSNVDVFVTLIFSEPIDSTDILVLAIQFISTSTSFCTANGATLQDGVPTSLTEALTTVSSTKQNFVVYNFAYVPNVLSVATILLQKPLFDFSAEFLGLAINGIFVPPEDITPSLGVLTVDNLTELAQEQPLLVELSTLSAFVPSSMNVTLIGGEIPLPPAPSEVTIDFTGSAPINSSTSSFSTNVAYSEGFGSLNVILTIANPQYSVGTSMQCLVIQNNTAAPVPFDFAGSAVDSVTENGNPVSVLGSYHRTVGTGSQFFIYGFGPTNNSAPILITLTCSNTMQANDISSCTMYYFSPSVIYPNFNNQLIDNTTGILSTAITKQGTTFVNTDEVLSIMFVNFDLGNPAQNINIIDITQDSPIDWNTTFATSKAIRWPMFTFIPDPPGLTALTPTTGRYTFGSPGQGVTVIPLVYQFTAQLTYNTNGFQSARLISL